MHVVIFKFLVFASLSKVNPWCLKWIPWLPSWNAVHNVRNRNTFKHITDSMHENLPGETGYTGKSRWRKRLVPWSRRVHTIRLRIRFDDSPLPTPRTMAACDGIINTEPRRAECNTEATGRSGKTVYEWNFLRSVAGARPGQKANHEGGCVGKLLPKDFLARWMVCGK